MMNARILVLSAVLIAPACAAWAQSGLDPQTGARPGNDIGTGMSLPLSDKAGNITPEDTTSPIAGRLPDPQVGENASVQALLLDARNALAAGRSGEAQEALERAQTRTLDRSVPLFQTSTPVQDPLIAGIRSVMQALGSGDRLEAMRRLEQVIAESAPRH